MRVYCLKGNDNGLPTIISRAARTTRFKHESPHTGFVYVPYNRRWLKLGEDCWMTEAEAQRALFAYLGNEVEVLQRRIEAERRILNTSTARLAALEAERARLEPLIAQSLPTE